MQDFTATSHAIAAHDYCHCRLAIVAILAVLARIV